MRRVALVLLVMGATFLIFAGMAAGSGSFDTRTAVRSPTADRGRELFVTSCASCHGAKGQGTGQGPPLIGVGAAMADFQLSTGRMPLADPGAQAVRKQPAFTPEEIRSLVAYVATLGGGTAIPRVDPAAGDLSQGGTLFRFNCAACHSATGAGGALSLGRDAPALAVATPTQIGEAMRTGPGQMPVFGPDTLSSRQVDSIARYVEYLQNPADPGGFSLGRIGPITEGMVALLLGIPLLLFIATRIEESHERQR